MIDKFGINHTLKNHGNVEIENKRGQIAITEVDFELIPQIVKSQNIIHVSKNKMGNDLILYESIVNDTFYYVEEVRKELCMTTMYKRKPTIINSWIKNQRVMLNFTYSLRPKRTLIMQI